MKEERYMGTKALLTKTRWLPALVALMVVAGTLQAGGISLAQGGSRTFPQTGKTVKGLFLNYWDQNGGLPQQGFPITDEFQNRSQTDGKTYTMQCFERAVFENHPENVGTPSEVLLSLLGNFYYKQKYQFAAPSSQHVSTDNPRFFDATKHTIGGIFRQYWEQNGGLAQQGFPISDEFQEKSDLDGKTYTVQYFERAVFESHPEQADPKYKVLLSQLGKFLCPATVKPTPIPTPDPNFAPNKLYRMTTEFRGDGLCLAARPDGSSSLMLQNCQVIQYQHFRITAGSGGTWKLSVELSGGNFNKCIDTGSLANCSSATGQFWIIKPTGGGYYSMTNTFTGTGKCLDINSANNQTEMRDCGNFTGQNWKFTEVK